jgi:hypothetical protein
MEKQVERERSETKLNDAMSLESTVTRTPVEFTPEEEKTVLRRIDWHVLPGLSVLYFLCFLDRTFDPVPILLRVETLEMPGL